MSGATIDTGDAVHHAPSGEDWTVAVVDGERVFWCGYPFGGYGYLSDCTLLTKATPEQREEVAQSVMRVQGDYEPTRILRARHAPAGREQEPQ